MILKFLYSFVIVFFGSLGAGILSILAKAAIDALQEKKTNKQAIGLMIFSTICIIVAAVIILCVLGKLGGIWENV